MERIAKEIMEISNVINDNKDLPEFDIIINDEETWFDKAIKEAEEGETNETS